MGDEVSPYTYKCSFCSWGNTDMYNPNDQNTFVGVYDWGGVNLQEPYYEGRPYGFTPGNILTADIGLTYDAARQHLGAPWRMPSSDEFRELVESCDFIDTDGNIVTAATSVSGTANDKRIMMNGVVGLRLRSRFNGNVIFFSATGDGVGNNWAGRGDSCGIWSTSWLSARNAQCLLFVSSGVYPQNTYGRYNGFAVRPVI